MEYILKAIEGPIGAFAMVSLSIFGISYLIFVVPYKIATDEKVLFGKRLLNIGYGLASVFFPFLPFLYLFSNAKRVAKPLVFATSCIIGSAGIFVMRSLVSTFFAV